MSVPRERTGTARRTAVVLGATGQDGSLLVERLLAEGLVVHAAARRPEVAEAMFEALGGAGSLLVHRLELEVPDTMTSLVGDVRPDELYNLAGETSVAASFENPGRLWRTVAGAVLAILEAIRTTSPDTRFFQPSSSEIFGPAPRGASPRDESTALRPGTPYGAAKAAAHLACSAYRRTFRLRVACGILFNHESSRRTTRFLSGKVAEHVRALRAGTRSRKEPLPVGNLAARRDWGYAPDFVDGMVRIIRQVEVRAERGVAAPEPDRGPAYRDYVLATGRLHAVWEVVDRAFAIGGFRLEWDRGGDDPARWSARFRDTGDIAVAVDPGLFRPDETPGIAGDPSRARLELGWEPRPGLDTFLREMVSGPAVAGERRMRSVRGNGGGG